MQNIIEMLDIFYNHLNVDCNSEVDEDKQNIANDNAH